MEGVRDERALQCEETCMLSAVDMHAPVSALFNDAIFIFQLERSRKANISSVNQIENNANERTYSEREMKYKRVKLAGI